VGSKLDSEFDAINLTINDIRTNLSLIQRDDTKVANLAIHAEALSTAVLALIKATENGYGVKGAWAASTAYVIGDLVESSQATYLCHTAHTSSSTFAANSSNFILLANAAIQTTASAVDTLDGDGSATAFTLSENTPSGVTEVLVFVNGSLQTPTTHYTISGTTITFTTAPSSGTDNIIVWGTSTAVEAAKAAALAAQTAAQTAESNAETAEANSEDSNLESEQWATKLGAVVNTFTSGSENSDGTLYSSKEHATGTTAESAKSWATKTGGDVPGGSSGDKSAKSWASETGVSAPVDGSAKEWAVGSGRIDDPTTGEYSSKEYATGTTAESAKSWATKTEGDVPGGELGDKSAKSWASETGADAPADGSSKEWATETGVVASSLKGAKGYADDAATTFADFETKYLGSKSADPTLDNEGNALIDGALYFNTTSNNLRFYNGSSFIVLDVELPQGLDTTDTPTFATPTADGHAVIKSYADPYHGPVITSFVYSDGASATAENPAGGGVITINGLNFDSTAASPASAANIAVVLDGTTATSISVNAAKTVITATVPAHAAGTIILKITNDNGLTAETNFIYDAEPAWTTAAGSLGSFVNGAYTNSGTIIRVVATEGGDTITYAQTDSSGTVITSGIQGLTLGTGLGSGANSPANAGYLTGTLSGTPDTTYFFYGRAIDAEGQHETTPRLFNIIVANKASGGTVTTYTGYRVHTFLVGDTGDDFTVNEAMDVDYLVVAAGGSGQNGGGGAGGVLTGSGHAVTVGDYEITVGAGGTSVGGNSVFSTFTANGGGWSSTNGGSGAGGTDNSAGQPGISGQGHGGGTSATAYYGGGGGAGGAGQGGAANSAGGIGTKEVMGLSDANSTILLANAGIGEVSGAFRYIAGGGGGADSSMPGGVGGLGGGGPATDNAITAAGTANTGGGGGGGLYYASGPGGSGVVIIRYAV